MIVVSCVLYVKFYKSTSFYHHFYHISPWTFNNNSSANLHSGIDATGTMCTTNQLILVIWAYKYIYWPQNKILSCPVDVKGVVKGKKNGVCAPQPL